MAGGRQRGRHARACGADLVVGNLRSYGLTTLVFIVFPDALTQGFTGDDPTMKFCQRIVDYLLVTTYSIFGVLAYDAIVERLAARHAAKAKADPTEQAVD
jgi:hypothetical protein